MRQWGQAALARWGLEARVREGPGPEDVTMRDEDEDPVRDEEKKAPASRKDAGKPKPEDSHEGEYRFRDWASI